jgi:hypothetical protein
MKTHDVQSVPVSTPRESAFEFIADPKNLPRWTSAFAAADATSAIMRTPAGEVAIALQTVANRQSGTIDWLMTFPDGFTAAAYSRVTPDGNMKCVYSFVLMTPPVPLEALEGALEVQMRTLAEELTRLKSLLETS